MAECLPFFNKAYDTGRPKSGNLFALQEEFEAELKRYEALENVSAAYKSTTSGIQQVEQLI